MQTNTVKRRLKAGEAVYGTSLEISLDPEMAFLLKAGGLDFFFVDTEHCPADYHQIQALCRTGRAAGIIPMVRVTQNEPDLITRALDVGAMGVIVPRVHSPAEARAAIECIKYIPEGRRGFGMRGIIHDFQFTNPLDEMASSNRETMAVLQVESKEALNCVEAIAATPGLDVLFIGPYDLTISMGIAEQFQSAEFWNAVDRVAAACKNAGIAGAIQSPDMKLLRESRRRGLKCLMYGSDVAILLNGYKSAIGEVKLDRL